MSKYVKEIKKYVFSSELVKGKAYHIIKDNDGFDVIFGFVDDMGDAMFLTIGDDNIRCEWINIKAEDVASGVVKIIELVQSFSSIYKIEKPNLDPEYIKKILNDIENGGGQSHLNIDNIRIRFNDLEEAYRHEEDLDNAYKDMYGIIHQPTVTEKESFFIEPDPNIHPV